MSKTNKLIAANTDWIDLKENPPPAYMYLLLQARLAGTDIPVLVLGYWSERANTFMNCDDGFALMETLDLLKYHAITDDDGKYVSVQGEFPV